jgi:hypothetical protein
MFALDASQSQTVTVSTYPSGYTNTASLRSAVSGSAIRLNSATLEVTASSEDPGAFTLSGATNGAVGGILIYAAAGAGSFTSTGALTGPGSTVSGSAKLGFVSTGALTGQGSAVAGTATRVFTATGALVGPGSVIAGSAQVSTGFTSTGALVGQGSTVSGTATRLFTATGALVGAGSAVAGTATRVFTAAGTLAGPGASLSGAATNGIFSASGALIGQGSIIAGTATKTNNFTAVGALVGQGSVLSGTAKRVFTGTGSLVGQGATIAGVASVAGLHSSTGALVGSGAILAGEAEQPDVVSYSITYTIEYNDLPYIILAAGAAILTVDDGPIRSYLWAWAMHTPVTQHIDRRRGNTADIDFVINQKSDGMPYDLTGWSFKLVVSSISRPPDNTTKIFESTATVSGSTVTAPINSTAAAFGGEMFYALRGTAPSGKTIDIVEGRYSVLESRAIT